MTFVHVEVERNIRTAAAEEYKKVPLWALFLLLTIITKVIINK